MEKYYFLKHKLWLYIVTIALIAMLLVASIINFVAVLGVTNLISDRPALDITAIVVMAFVIIVLIIAVFLSGYAINKDCISAFLGLTCFKIYYDKILLIRENSEKTMLVLYVEDDDHPEIKDEDSGLQARIIQISIANSQFEDFISKIKMHNANVPFEIIPSEVK